MTANNRIATDGTYNYSYDGEGNIVLRTKISDGSYTTYTWDHRNRLIEVTDFDNQSAELTRIEYGYDGSDDLVRRRRFDNGSSTAAESLVFVYDRGQMAFELEDTGNADLTHDDLAHRYLWGGGQQLLADEAIASLTDAELNTSRWALSDHFACSPIPDPCVMRVSTAQEGKETQDVDEATEATHAGADRAEAA